MELALELSMGRFRAGDALERTRLSIPAQTLFGAILGAALELLHDRDPEGFLEFAKLISKGLELTDAFPTCRWNDSHEPALPVPEHLRLKLSDPDRFEEILRELSNEDVRPDFHTTIAEPEWVPLPVFTDLCLDESELGERKRLKKWLSKEPEPMVGAARSTHATVPRTGEDTTPFTVDYASGRGSHPDVPTHVALLRYEGDGKDHVKKTLKAALRYLEDVGLGGSRTRGAGDVRWTRLREPKGEERRLFSQRRNVEEGEPAITLSACYPSEEVEFHGRLERRGMHYARIGPYVTNYRVPRHYLAATGSFFREWPGTENPKFKVPERLLPGFLRSNPLYENGYTLIVYGRGFPVRARHLE